MKFLRKIRQKLLSENKFSKYFIYAIGEIALVVIGILIALSINNWNENKKDRKQERELLIQLESEFKSNLEQLDEKITLREDMIAASIKLLEYKDSPITRNSDSILIFIGKTLLAPTFDPIVNDIISSGRIQLLLNSNLKEKLSRWTSEIVQVTEEEKAWYDYRENNYIPSLVKQDVFRSIISKYLETNMIGTFHLDKGTETDLKIPMSPKKIDVSDLLDRSNFDNHIAQCASFSQLTNSQSYSLRNRIIEILDVMSKELEE